MIQEHETASDLHVQRCLPAIEYTTRGGIRIRRASTPVDPVRSVRAIAESLDHDRGVLLSSSYAYPGRYTRWNIGFSRPLLVMEGKGREFHVAALKPSGRPVVELIAGALRRLADVVEVEPSDIEPCDVERTVGYASVPCCEIGFVGTVATPSELATEEERTRRPTFFSAVRAVVDLFFSHEDGHLGLYGAFGYDLAFQLEPIVRVRARAASHRDLVLYLPDEIVVVDHARGTAERICYEIEGGVVARKAGVVACESERASASVGPFDPFDPSDSSDSSEPLAPTIRSSFPVATLPQAGAEVTSDHEPGAYADVVRRALDAFGSGELFEVTPSQTLSLATGAPPSLLFEELRTRNPSPYGFVVNLGRGEHLVGASPEMYVRVRGDRVETCPIAGTIARGSDALEDSAQIRRLLESAKDEAELTMCTDVDRNDKSRVCRAGTVRVIGRRQIEMYSRLIHTVDHVEGYLREGYDALDAFLSHMWAVTVTGAPKIAAMQFIEDHERSPRQYYGGAVGRVCFDGDLDTGLVLRTIHLGRGVARVRVGATLLFASDPHDEERETRLKASALLDVVADHENRARRPCAVLGHEDATTATLLAPRACTGADGATLATLPAAPPLRVLVVDHEDSFVHTLGSYFRETGAQVVTLRASAARERIRSHECPPDLVVLSPGPGNPTRFRLDLTLALLVGRAIPTFGVCLGLQGIVEYFGGTLGRLSLPRHGVGSTVRVLLPGRILAGLPESFTAGRYHSLYAERDDLPAVLCVTAESDDGVIMAVEHVDLPIAAVQFHPESIMTLSGDHGRIIVANVVERLARGLTFFDAIEPSRARAR